MTRYHVAILGATGMVGQEMLETLLDRNFPAERITLLASARSAGKTVTCRGRDFTVERAVPEAFEGVDVVLASAGGSVSAALAPEAVKRGAVVIDNTSYFRMDPTVPLVIPEINPHALDGHHGIIANPNCSTIQLVVALEPLRRAVGIERIVVSTYQSVSGAGQKGIDELVEATRAWAAGEPDPAPLKFAHPIAFEALPHIDTFFDSGFTREELKMVHETRKIMGLPALRVAATCVRVPVMRSHSEAVTVDLSAPLSADEARALWADAPGVVLQDDPQNHVYPLARKAAGQEATFVGRVRADLDLPSTLHFWVVSDNLLKGAALNAVQIAEALVARA